MPPLLKSKKINRSQLLFWTDVDLGNSLTRWLGIPDPRHVNLGKVFPKILAFNSWEDAREAEERAAKKGDLTLIHSMKGDRPIKPKTSSYFVKPNGSPQSFEEARPAESWQIKQLADNIPIEGAAWLIKYDGLVKKLPQEMVDAWRKMRRGWDKELGCEMVA